MRDLHNNITAKRAVSPVALGTTGSGGGKTSVVIDRNGYDSLEYIVDVGTITATNATVVAVISECATSNGAFTSVADADLLGTEALAGVGQATPRTSGVSKNVSKRVGYRGSKRYTKIQLYSTVSAGIIGGATALLGNPMLGPAA